MHKLSLSEKDHQTSSMENDEETDVRIPSKQEDLHKNQNTDSPDDDDFDYGLDLTPVNAPSNGDSDIEHASIVSEACNNFARKLELRYNIACAREGMSYGINGGKTPPFMKVTMYCHPNLGSPTTNKEFQNLWNTEITCAKNTLMGKAIQFLDTKIDAINDELKDIRENALLKNWKEHGIGRTCKNATHSGNE